jgi:uncharacterized protein YcbX
MTNIRITGLYRYPVKSLGGEAVESLEIGASGPVGDRNWAVLDAETQEIRSAKRWPALLGLHARYLEVPIADAFGDAVSPVGLTAPDGSTARSDDPDVDAWLSTQLGRPARLSARQPAHLRAHYRLAHGKRTPQEIAADIDLLTDEVLPDFDATDDMLLAQLKTYATPPGSYVDAFPAHLVSQNALDSLAALSGLDTSVERFRPNLLVSVDDGGDRPELGWIGRRLVAGDLTLAIRSSTMRCSMPARPQPLLRLDAEPKLTRALVDHCQRTLGVNVVIERSGTVHRGDLVRVMDEDPA